jgi:23S rRNA pseudouridine1911/1915/1917 synthase
MPAKKKRPPFIPPGAPGHPKTGAEARPAPPPPPEWRERESTRVPAPRPSAERAVARLVYEDETILGYDKPVGLPVIAPEGSRTRCLLDIASERVARTSSKSRAAVVHRIDRDTSGIVIFAIDGRTKKLLMDGWDELVTRRLYIALVEGTMPQGDGVFDSWLKENKGGEVYRAEPKDKGAKQAVTRWRVLAQGSSLSLLELSLETGRKHQIRVQLADSGHPVVGDERYGATLGPKTRDSAPAPDLGRLCLHARLIELKLPGREALVIESPSPPEFDAAIRADSRPRRAAPRKGGSLTGGAKRDAAAKGAAPRRPSPSRAPAAKKPAK